ncbi:MAG: O-antigen ligase family protein [Myxococcota bacterium]
MPSSTTTRRGRRLPWSRVLLSLGVGGPALAIGGVPPELVAMACVLVGALLYRIARKGSGPMPVPRVALALLFLAGWTALAVLPIPGLRALVAPGLDSWITDAAALGPVEPVATLSVRPADTGLEVARLLALAGLALAAAQLSWRLVAAIVSATGLAVTGVGIVHAFLGADTIYGVYAPLQASLAPRAALLGPFVNPNHQSALLLLGTFATAALAVDQLHGSRIARDASKVDARRDRGIAAAFAITLLVPALLLSLSRGAILAFAFVAPFGVAVALRGHPAPRSSTKPRVRRAWTRAAAVGALACLVVLVGRHGAWAELQTLFADPSGAADQKFTPVLAALGLIRASPVLGTGRGTALDLVGVQAPGSDLVYTHIESAPVAALVEWGPLVGTLAVGLVAFGWVGAYRAAGEGRDGRARRLLLLGVAAVLLHSVVDFSLEFLGVAAPMVAVMAAVAPHGSASVPRRRMRTVAPVAGLVAALAAGWLAPKTWARVSSTPEALPHRPLDPQLHVHAARAALEAADPSRALGHATYATEVQPGSIDAWLLRAAALDRLGEPDAANEAVRSGLDRVRAPCPPALVDYLQARFVDPQAAGVVSPTREHAWRAVVQGLRSGGALDHADALAAARTLSHPDDPRPLLVRSQLALQQDRPGLGLHFARLAGATDPASADVQLALARATAARFGVPEALASLDDAPRERMEPKAVERLDELRVQLLTQLGTPQALATAASLAEALLLRSDSDAEASRRRALRRAVHDATR